MLFSYSQSKIGAFSIWNLGFLDHISYYATHYCNIIKLDEHHEEIRRFEVRPSYFIFLVDRR